MGENTTGSPYGVDTSGMLGRLTRHDQRFCRPFFLPGRAFKKQGNSVWWDKLLTGKTARIITTLDQPRWYYLLVYRSPSINALKKITLQYCGGKSVKGIKMALSAPTMIYKEKNG